MPLVRSFHHFMSDDARDPPSVPTASGTDEQLDRVRRRMIKIGVYATPLVLGTISLRKARAQPKSCKPMHCKPKGG
jgi:hypothetical protein